MERNRNQSQNCSNYQRGLQTSISTTSSFINNSPNNKLLSGSNQKPSLNRSSPEIIRQRSHRTSPQCIKSRVLLQGFSGTKEGRLEANNRPQLPQHLSGNSKVQNGNSRVCESIYPSGGMDNFHRPHRCLPTRSNPSSFQKIPKIQNRGQSLPIQGTAFRIGNSPLPFYQDCQSPEGVLYNPGPDHPSISRRLDKQDIIISAGSGESETTDEYFGKPGFLNQPKEIPVSTYSEHDLHRLSLQPYEGYCAPTRREGHCPSTGNTLVSQTAENICEKPNACHWSSGGNRKDGSLWQDPSEATAALSQQPMGLEDFIGVSNPSGQIINRSPNLVEYQREPCKRISSPSRAGRCPDIYRCLKHGVGCPLPSKKYRRSVDPRRAEQTYKYIGDESCLASSPTLSTSVEKQSCSSINRQLNSGLIYQQTRRHQVHRPVCSHLENNDLDQEKQDHFNSQTHSRLPECNGRSPVQVSQNTEYRMVSEPSDIQRLSREIGETKHRHVFNLPKQQVANICITIPRPCSVGSGCYVHKLDKSALLCLPSNKSIDQSDLQDQEGSLQSTSNSSTLAPDAMVSGVDGSNNTRPNQTSTSVVPPEATPQADFQPEVGTDEPPCIPNPVITLKQQGFEDKLAERIANPQRENTLKIYKGKWNIFLKWTNLKETEISKIDIPLIAKFLLYLFEDQNLEVSTIDGYKTAIANHLKIISPLDVSNNENLRDLIRSFYRDRPRNMRTLPHWDLSVVLNALSKPPFEPMAEAQLKWLTLKTVFLVTLASGKRRSEIHALVFNNIKYNKSEDSYSLGICPSFVAKNQVTRKLNESLRSIKIIGLRKRVCPDMSQERSLCPVRALSFYLDRTKSLRGNTQRKLFISFRENFQKDICANTISGWIKSVIRFAYDKEIPDQDLKKLNLTAHSVRSVAVSWAATGGASIDQILNACQWQSESSFTSFYLKEVDWKHNNQQIPQFVAAQKIVQPNLMK